MPKGYILAAHRSPANPKKRNAYIKLALPAIASAGGKFSRGESVLDFLNLPYDTIFLMPTWASTIVLLAGVASSIIAVLNLKKSSSIEH